MKRYGNLYHKIVEFDNLLLAAKKAQKGKRFNPNILAFNHSLESELLKLQQELSSQTYQPGDYTTFQIIEPKPRLISAAPYRDRVVHHALCNIIVPLIEPRLIADTYANRVGFGTHRALNRFTQFARFSSYVLQCDIRKYFPTIDHEILKGEIRRHIKCRDTLGLIESIIDNSNEQETMIQYFPGDDLLTPIQRRKGLPIGNLTSQFFANLYLNRFDHYIKETLRVKKYLRYVDDFALFANDWQSLHEIRFLLEDFLAKFRLKIHPIKSQLFQTKIGASFLGFRIFPHTIRVKSDNLRRARKRLKKLQLAFEQGKVDMAKVEECLQSWQAHLNYGNTTALQKDIFDKLVFTALN